MSDLVGSPQDRFSHNAAHLDAETYPVGQHQPEHISHKSDQMYPVYMCCCVDNSVETGTGRNGTLLKKIKQALMSLSFATLTASQVELQHIHYENMPM